MGENEIIAVKSSTYCNIQVDSKLQAWNKTQISRTTVLTHYIFLQAITYYASSNTPSIDGNCMIILCIENDCPKTIPSSLYSDLQHKLTVECHNIPSSSLTQYMNTTETHLCIIDYYSAQQYSKNIQLISNLNQQWFTVVYRAPKKITTSQLLNLGRIVGYFYHQDTTKTIEAGINKIVQGERALPEQINDQLLSYYQSLSIRYHNPHRMNLTKREIEVLTCLKDGYSNTKLADTLFVSEHTVKSHLHNIYKKLNIKKRSQAIAWTYKYLL